MNRKIELHDSTIAEVRIQNRTVTLHFAPAYLHMSEGRPGFDAGSGWVQEANLIFLEAETSGSLPDLPATLVDGEMIIGEQTFSNLVSVPLDTLSATSLRLVFDLGHSFSIVGNCVRLDLVGKPKFVEEFLGHTPESL